VVFMHPQAAENVVKPDGLKAGATWAISLEILSKRLFF